jgi:ketosteroid isomerase-like protein
VKRAIWIALMICIGTWVALGQESGDTDAKSKVMALERLWGAAAQMRDTNALGSILDDSLTYVDIDGRLMTRSEVLQDTKAVSAVEIVVQSAAARSHGNTVVVTGVLRLKGIEHRKPYVRYGRFVDTWFYKEGHWVCIASMTTPITQ